MIKDTNERERIIEIIRAAMAANEAPEIAVRRIFKTMPHVTAADVSEIAAVHAEEARMDAAEYQARADGNFS
jgi:hypothetical protein